MVLELDCLKRLTINPTIILGGELYITILTSDIEQCQQVKTLLKIWREWLLKFDQYDENFNIWKDNMEYCCKINFGRYLAILWGYEMPRDEDGKELREWVGQRCKSKFMKGIWK